MLGGFHFNDRRYADDDLTIGSIDPYQIFRIFQEIQAFEAETGTHADISYMIDQSHNLKGKIEAMVQTVATAQEIYAKAALVDRAKLEHYQQQCDLVQAEETYRQAFWTDVKPLLHAWRQEKGLPEDPQQAFRDSGYLEQITRQRGARNVAAIATYA